jgi:hypothetical protein
VILNTINIKGISLMGSAGFLIIFAAVNVAAAHLEAHTPTNLAVSVAGAIACLGSLAALITYATTHIPAQLGVLAGMLALAGVGEAVIRRHGRMPPAGRERSS